MARSHDSYINVPVGEFGFLEEDACQVRDLLWDERCLCRGRRKFVVLNPHQKPAHICRWISREQDFDYFL